MLNGRPCYTWRVLYVLREPPHSDGTAAYIENNASVYNHNRCQVSRYEALSTIYTVASF